MSIALTLDGGAAPAIDVTISTPDGSAFSAIMVSRIADGQTVQTRQQPVTGLASVTVTDLEAPWDVDVSYTATVVHGGTSETYSAGPITVSSTSAWLIHPTRPWLSIPIDQGDPEVAGIVQIGQVVRAASSTSHTVLRSRYPVITTFGPRLAPTFPLMVQTTSQAEQDALITITDDQTPLLLRFPATIPANIEAGFYSVGDITEDRVVQYAGDPARNFTLPLTRVAAPAGTQQTTWDYNALDAMTDYDAITSSFSDYSALTAGQSN